MHHLLGLIFFSCPTRRRCILGKFQELMNARRVDVYLAYQPGPDGVGAPGITSLSDSVHLSHEQPFPHLNLSPPPPPTPPLPAEALPPSHPPLFHSPGPNTPQSGGSGDVYSSGKGRKGVNDESRRPGGAPTPARPRWASEVRGRCSGSDAPGGGRESCQADGEDGRSGGRRRRCDAEPVLRRAVQSEPGSQSTSCNLGTGGGGGTCASSRAPRCPLRPAKPGAAARRSLWMSRRPPTGWPPSRTGSCESPATMATTRVTPARKVRRRGAALLQARGGVGGGRERRPDTCSLAVPGCRGATG